MHSARRSGEGGAGQGQSVDPSSAFLPHDWLPPSTKVAAKPQIAARSESSAIAGSRFPTPLGMLSFQQTVRNTKKPRPSEWGSALRLGTHRDRMGSERSLPLSPPFQLPQIVVDEAPPTGAAHALTVSGPSAA